MEIGSEFWTESISGTEYKDQMPEWVNKFGNTILTHSGRGAISLMLKEVEAKVKTILLPAYICDSVILPFIEQGYKCYFYDIGNNLTPSLKRIEAYDSIGIFLHMGYYGFSTNNSLSDVVKLFKANSTIIVEDITHTVLSDYRRFNENDYYVASLRKWMGLPSGGFIASKKLISCRPKRNDTFADIRKEALQVKARYMNGNDKRLKKQYLDLFTKAEKFLENDLAPYDIDALSKELISALDVKKLIEKRQFNFKLLADGLKGLEYIEPVFDGLPENICPLSFPVYIKEKRNAIRQKLIEQKIYCPIHWPVPEQIDDLKNTGKIYSTALSIPCDQRYGASDMERVVEAIQGLKIHTSG